MKYNKSFSTVEKHWHVFCDNCKKEVQVEECTLSVKYANEQGVADPELYGKGKHDSCGGKILSLLVLR